jgi:hypothetical protein
MRVEKIDNENYNVYTFDSAGREVKEVLRLNHKIQSVSFSMDSKFFNPVDLTNVAMKLGREVFGWRKLV